MTHHKVKMSSGEHYGCKIVDRIDTPRRPEDTVEEFADLEELLKSIGLDRKLYQSDIPLAEGATPKYTTVVAREGAEKPEVQNGVLIIDRTDQYRVFVDVEGTYWIHKAGIEENRMVSPVEWEAVLTDYTTPGGRWHEKPWDEALAHVYSMALVPN